MTLAEAVKLHLDPDQTATCVVAYRFTGSAKPGSRIDMRCCVCDERVALCNTSVRHVESGWLLFCRECLIAMERESKKPVVLSGELT